MNRKRRNLFTLGAIGLAIILFAVLGITQTQKASTKIAEAQDIPSTDTGIPSIGGTFELVDSTGKTRKDTDFKGKPMLVYFGYTYCPDICPMALDNMTAALDKLGGNKDIQPIFITIDPQRDTVNLLQGYGENFHKDFVMLTGTEAQVKKAIKAYRVHAARASEDRGADDYLMDHSSLIYLMDKNGVYRAHFNHKTAPDEIIKRVKAHLESGE